jgi:hypothetical protein
VLALILAPPPVSLRLGSRSRTRGRTPPGRGPMGSRVARTAWLAGTARVARVARTAWLAGTVRVAGAAGVARAAPGSAGSRILRLAGVTRMPRILRGFVCNSWRDERSRDEHGDQAPQQFHLPLLCPIRLATFQVLIGRSEVSLYPGSSAATRCLRIGCDRIGWPGSS